MVRHVTASVWWLDLAKLPVSGTRLDHVLTAAERARQIRYWQAGDRLRFAAGRALCRVVLARMTGSSVTDIRIAIGKHGRPYVESGADGAWFNLTHSGAVVALAVAPFPLIGIDTEAERPAIANELAATVCTGAERAVLAGLDPATRRRRFFDLWTLKEAHMKAAGLGFGIDPLQCEFDAAALPFAMRLPSGDRDAWQFAMWRLPAGQTLSVCARPPDGQKMLMIDAPQRADAALVAGLSGQIGR